MDYKTKSSLAVGKRENLRYNEISKSDKVLDLTPVPSKVIADASGAATYVGKGNLCRIFGTAGGWVVFGDSTVVVPIITTQNAIQTIAAAPFMVIATDDYIFTSAAMRIEVTED